MIRVLQVIGKMDRAGAETMLMNIYRNIDRSKIQFDFLVFSEEEGDYDKEIESLGGTIYHMPAFKGYNYFELCKKFKPFFKEHPYKIVHGHIGSLAPAYLKYAKQNGAYAIAHSHATHSNIWKEKVIFMAFAFWVRYVADYFFACSREAGEDRFGGKIVCSDRFQIIRNAIDSRAFRYSESRHKKLKKEFMLEGKKVIGHVGRFVPVKNHKFIVEVFEKICQDNDEYRLVFVGAGSEENTIKEMVSQKGLSEKVTFMGVREDIPDMMNLFDVFIFPSMYEGLGNVGIEAQAAGLPCFFSTSIPDEAIVTKNVWKYPLSSGPEVWKDQIVSVLDNFDRKDTYEEIVKSGFDIVSAVKDVERFYMEH